MGVHLEKKHVEGISLDEKWPIMDMRFMHESCFVVSQGDGILILPGLWQSVVSRCVL